MSEGTKIEWATHTFNPWIGCTKVSPGCAHCYAENMTPARVLRSQGQETWGKGRPRSRTSAATWRGPVKWNRAAGSTLQRPRVFPSLCDWLDDEVPIEWLADFMRLVHETPNLDWLLLTKRPENWRGRLLSCCAHWASAKCSTGNGTVFLWIDDWLKGHAPVNVWIGTSVEDQKRADERIPELLKVPAAVRFLSVEPLLREVDLAYSCFNGADSFGSMPGIHWVIVGGESGTGARPCNVEWIRSIVQQCKAAGVPCFVKQMGRWPMMLQEEEGPKSRGMEMSALQLKHPKGGDPAEWPQDLRIREFPTVCQERSRS